MVVVYVGTDDASDVFERVYTHLAQSYPRTDAVWGTWLQCAPMRDEQKNLFFMRAPKNVRVTKNDDGLVLDGVEQLYPETWVDALTFEVSRNIFLYCSEPLDVSITSAYNHDTGANRDGFIVDARMCINKWYRRLRIAYQGFPNRRDFSWNEGDPLCYVRFHTDELINFVPYVVTDELSMLEQELQQWQLVNRHVSNRPPNHVVLAQQWLTERGFDRNTFNERVLTAIHNSLDKNS